MVSVVASLLHFEGSRCFVVEMPAQQLSGRTVCELSDTAQILCVGHNINSHQYVVHYISSCLHVEGSVVI